jgi:hypothetical protein
MVDQARIEKLELNVGELTTSLGKLSERMFDWVERQEEDMKKRGGTSTEVAKQLNGGAKEWTKILEELGEVRSEQSKITDRLSGIEALGSRRGGTSKAKEQDDWFERLVSLEQVKQFRADVKSVKQTSRIEVPLPMRLSKKETATTTTDVHNVPTQGPSAQDPRRMLMVRDLLAQVTISTTSWEYAQLTGEYFITTETTSSVGAGDTVINVVNSNGYKPGATVYFENGTAKSGVILSIDADAKTITLTAVTGFTAASGARVWSKDFVFTPETNVKPYSEFNWTAATATPKTISSIIPLTQQMLQDNATLRAIIETLGVANLLTQEEKQFLYGDASATQIQGIITNTAHPQYLWSSGVVGDLKMDAIRRAMTVMAKNDFALGALGPASVIVSPDDLESMDLSKSDVGDYLWLNMNGMAWSARVVESNSLAAGDAAVGMFNPAIWAVDRENAPNISFSDSHADFFAKNMVAMRIERRVDLATLLPKAVVRISFDSAPT